MNQEPSRPTDSPEPSRFSERTRTLLEEYRAERRRAAEEAEREAEEMGVRIHVQHGHYCGPPPAMLSRRGDIAVLVRFRLLAGDVERTDCVRHIPEHLRHASHAELLDYLIEHERADHARPSLVYLLDKVLTGCIIESEHDDEVAIW